MVAVFYDGALGAEIQTHGERGRPSVVVQNDRGNAACSCTIVVPLKDAAGFRGYSETAFVSQAELGGGGAKDSVAECGQIRTVDIEGRINWELGVLSRLDDAVMARIDQAIAASLDLRLGSAHDSLDRRPVPAGTTLNPPEPPQRGRHQALPSRPATDEAEATP